MWDRLWIVYNSTKQSVVSEPEGEGWEILCDASDSSRWQSPSPVGKRVEAEPQSVLILGHRADGFASRAGIVLIRDGEEEEKQKKSGQRQRKEWQEEKDAV